MHVKTAMSLIVLSATILIQGCDKIDPGSVPQASTGTAILKIAVVQLSRQPDIYEATGTVRALTSSVVASKLMGTVNRILVTEGQSVDAGELLLTLDQRQVAAQQQQTEAALAAARKAEAAALSALEAARAGAELARSNHSRYLAMRAEEAVTPSEVDAVVAGYRQAQAAMDQAEAMAAAARSRVEQATAAVTAARITSGDASVEAPYKGIVAAKLVDVGDLASPGTPLLTIEQTDGYRIELEVPESLIHTVRLGQSVSVQIPATGGPPAAAQVEAIAPAADDRSRSFLVKVRLPTAANVKSGMFARVAIPVGAVNLITVPLSAIVSQGQLTGIYILDSDQVARFRLLRTGRAIGDSIEVLSGLMEGTRYVVSPPSGFKDGTRVEGMAS